MKKIKLTLSVILLASLMASFGGISLAETLPKWQKVVTGKAISIDEKNNRFTIAYQEKKPLKKTEDKKLTLNVWKTYKPTEILIGNEQGSLEDIKEGDTVRVTYEVTASAGNVAYKVEVINP